MNKWCQQIIKEKKEQNKNTRRNNHRTNAAQHSTAIFEYHQLKPWDGIKWMREHYLNHKIIPMKATHSFTYSLAAKRLEVVAAECCLPLPFYLWNLHKLNGVATVCIHFWRCRLFASYFLLFHHLRRRRLWRFCFTKVPDITKSTGSMVFQFLASLWWL